MGSISTFSDKMIVSSANIDLKLEVCLAEQVGRMLSLEIEERYRKLKSKSRLYDSVQITVILVLLK